MQFTAFKYDLIACLCFQKRFKSGRVCVDAECEIGVSAGQNDASKPEHARHCSADNANVKSPRPGPALAHTKPMQCGDSDASVARLCNFTPPLIGKEHRRNTNAAL